MQTRIQRSMLILPVNVPRFVEKAYLRGADAIVLDLEDAVPRSEKDNARQLVKDAVVMAGQGGADVLVRVNNDPALLDKDLEATVHPGLHAVFMPKIEAPEQITALGAKLSDIELRRGIQVGQTKVAVHIESPRGVLKLQDIVAAGTRVESVSMGVDDYCLSLGIEPSEDAMELLLPVSMMIIVCKAAGISPMGIFGSVAGYRDAVGFERAARQSCDIGCTGAFCIHPDQVPILNRVFSPPPARIEHARRVVAAFEEGLKNGRASVSLDNRMVDPPIYKQALLVIERAEAISNLEQRKAQALTRAGHTNECSNK